MELCDYLLVSGGRWYLYIYIHIYHICVTPTSRCVNLYKFVSLYLFKLYDYFCLVMSKGLLVTEATPKDLTFKNKKGIYKL